MEDKVDAQKTIENKQEESKVADTTNNDKDAGASTQEAPKKKT